MLAEEAIKVSTSALEMAEKAASLQTRKDQDEELQEMEAMLVLAKAATKLAEDNQAKLSQLECSLTDKGIGPARLSVSRLTDEERSGPGLWAWLFPREK
jgi:Cdc6-like AAA superfamily ATPase